MRSMASRVMIARSFDESVFEPPPLNSWGRMNSAANAIRMIGRKRRTSTAEQPYRHAGAERRVNLAEQAHEVGRPGRSWPERLRGEAPAHAQVRSGAAEDGELVRRAVEVHVAVDPDGPIGQEDSGGTVAGPPGREDAQAPDVSHARPAAGSVPAEQVRRRRDRVAHIRLVVAVVVDQPSVCRPGDFEEADRSR